MFDFDAGKFLIIGVVALIVIGPKELPRVLRQVGQAVRRIKRMASEFQGQFMDAMKEADIESMREEVQKLGADVDLNSHFDPARDIQRELTSAMDDPKTAEAIPALTGIHGVTEGFSLPAPAETAAEAEAHEHENDPEHALVDASGLTAPAEPEHAGVAADAPFANGAATTMMPARKRKILMPKRRAPAVGGVHAVSDRTAVARARAGRRQGQEAAER